MAKHRKAVAAQADDPSRRRAAATRGGVLAVAVAICMAGSFELFASASAALGGSHAASLGGSRHARLIAPPRGYRAPRRTGPSAHAASSSPPTPGLPGAPARVPRRVGGSSVTAVGDSVMVASTPAMQKALPGIYIDAMVGRQFSAGLQVIAGLKARGLLRRIVVVGLGTNGTVTAEEIRQLFAEIGSGRRLVLVNTFEDRSWEHEVNATLAAAAADHPGVVLANWHATIEHRTNLLWPDGIHPQPGGGIVYARMLKRALDRLLNLPGSALAHRAR